MFGCGVGLAAERQGFMDAGMCIGVLAGVIVLFGGLAVRNLARRG